MRRPALALALTTALLVAALPSAAPAAQRTITKRFGPIAIGPYAVKYRTSRFPSPKVGGHIVRMHARIVGSNGAPMPVSRMMLHHLTFKDLGRPGHTKRDTTYCPGRLGRRFYGTGEEDRELIFPPGYGYKVHRKDRWDANWMLMNHGAKADRAWIEYTITVDDAPLTGVKAYWVGVVPGCGLDPIFDVDGDGPPGSVHTEQRPWRVPQNGRIVAAGGHMHGGAFNVKLREPACADRELFTSRPLYGNADHPYYNVLPNLHEPGPISSSIITTAAGVPVSKGEQLRVTTDYDASVMHVRAMGIMHVYVAPPVKGAAPPACAPLPADYVDTLQKPDGRLAPPDWVVPLTGLDANGNAIVIERPPGPVKRVEAPERLTIDVTNPRLAPGNLDVPVGTTIRWRFADELKHDITVADGPSAFSSQPLSKGITYEQRLDRPGAYKLFCSLHPVAMTQRIDVR